MPWSLQRFQKTGDLHFITFSCDHRQPLLDPVARRLFERALEAQRIRYEFYVVGYVVMPEHVHLLLSEPERSTLATAIQAIKQSVARKIPALAKTALGRGTRPVERAGKLVTTHFWEERYYDFNVWSRRKMIEKLRYMHRNPVARGLVEKPEDWEWSSFRHYLTGERGIVEIESFWTARERERRNIPALAKPGLGRGTQSA